MLLIADVRDWLQTLDPAIQDQIACGAIDGSAERFIGVYGDDADEPARLCLGGASQTRMQTRRVKLLVHWTVTPTTAERKAADLWALLRGASGTARQCRIVSVDPGAAPIPVGRDDRGICEYVIRAKIIYEE